MRKVLSVLIIVLVAYLAGYLPMKARIAALQQEAEAVRRQLETRLATTEENLRLARLQVRLGLLLVEVEQNNLGKARDISTQFFDEVRSELHTSKDAVVRAKLESALKRRDQVTGDLAAAKPGTAELLRLFLAEFLVDTRTPRLPQ